ncbi:MAG: hypothetical protein K2H15_01070, partial [Muribaculaceae bacterium]|nr:hypothetical protein [Muribaculaceae bacterium]
MKVDDFLRMGFASSVKVDKTFICEEKDKGAKLNRITIINIPTDSIALKLEHISMEGLTAKSIVKKLGYNQHCDYVIVTPDKCVFIEMKSNPN